MEELITAAVRKLLGEIDKELGKDAPDTCKVRELVSTVLAVIEARRFTSQVCTDDRYRRFEVLRTNQLSAFDALVDSKALTRADLRILLTTVRIRDGFEDTLL